MIKKKYIKPDIYSKKARVVQLIMESPGVIVPDVPSEDGDLNSSRERGIFDSPVSYDEEWNSVWKL